MSCLVGAGAHTPLGRNLAESAAAVRAGICRFEEHPHLVDAWGEALSISAAPGLDLELPAAERLVRLGRRAVHEALVRSLRGSSLTPGAGPLRCFLALPEPRPGRPGELDSTLAAAFTAMLGRWGAKADLSVLPLGHAAGLAALVRAHEAITSGESELCLVGGVDSLMEPETLDWLEAAGRLRTSEVGYGLVPGEGAGFCLLASEKLAARHGLRVFARVAGGGLADEPNRIGTGTVCTGTGLSAAFDLALSGLPDGEKVDQWMCDLDGEPYRTDEVGFTLARTGGRFRDPGSFLAPADGWGDVGAASGPLFLGLIAASVIRGHCRARHTLLSAGSDGGLRAAVLIRTEPSPIGDR